MAIETEVRLVGQAGPRSVADGVEVVPRLDKHGSMLGSFTGDIAEAMRRGMCFTASNVAAQAVTVALATTYTGLLVYNPLGSGKRMSLLAAKYALSVAPAAIASLHLIAFDSGVITHTTPLAAPGIKNALIGLGQPTSVMGADSAATIPTPYYKMSMGSGFTAAALYADPTSGWCWINGSIGVDPGGGLAWGALTAVTGFGSYLWAEESI